MSTALFTRLICGIAITFCVAFAHAFSWENITTDTVLYLHAGRGQNTGQGPAFFPVNILGMPDPRASDTTPTTDPRSICSIGLGGTIVLGFTEHVIVDGPGTDFTVFENAFKYSSSRIYAEPAVVSVSSDGITWKEFPFNAQTLDGCAGVTPTSGQDPFDASQSGGDAFDLVDIGADSIRWIKIVDITDSVLLNTNHPYYDPTLTGFDLDAIVSAHGVSAPISPALFVKPKSTTVEAHVVSGTALFNVYDLQGRLLSTETLPPGIHTREMSRYVNACLLVSLFTQNTLFTAKVLQ